jgi:DNA invertase Pin-like site-specific DNA recombinase
MNAGRNLPVSVLRRKAIVYVRQSTPGQVHQNLESQRRQYDLVDVARNYGFSAIDVIDDDLGRSASGAVARPGFDQLVAELCSGSVGAVLCLEASRLSRNGRDWHHLLELCGLVEARVIDLDGVYNPCLPNDRLLLGMKGTMSEFELGILRTRLLEAARAKAQRGELRIPVPIGFVWDRDSDVHFDPDLRIQEVIRLVFRKFDELGSARQVLLWMRHEDVHFPRPSDGKRLISFDWTPPRYRNVINTLKNPFYAGVYAYGKSETRTEIVDGRARKRYGLVKPIEEWDVLLQDHHEGYISWRQYELNQAQLARNAFGKSGGVKSGRGGRALLAGLIRCRRCGRRFKVVYTGKAAKPKYLCEQPFLVLTLPRCMAFAAWSVDEAVSAELIRAVEPLALEAAREAEQLQQNQQNERCHIAELELEQARYEAQLAERRYAACDPDNRLIAAQLEKSWEASLQRVQACDKKIDSLTIPKALTQETEDLDDLADDLQEAWDAPTTTMRTRQRLVRALVEEIIADLDEKSGEIVLTIHWKGGQHSELRTHKPKTGEHRKRISSEADAIIQSMAGKWSDEQIAATLNRMGFQTGQGNTWTARRVGSFRSTHKICAYRSAQDDQWLTMTEAARKLGVTNHIIRNMIRQGILPAEQAAPRAPYQIRVKDLSSDSVRDALTRRKNPRHTNSKSQVSLFPNT